jgi:predicted small integral membrane protein
MEQLNYEHPRVELSSQLVSIMTTEHYNLRMALSMNTSEITGRSSLFVGAVSSGVIALAFVGQVSHLAAAFFVFSLVVIAALFMMGLFTFERVLESSNTQFMYARGINRIRHLYLEYAPQMRPYFILSSHDDLEGTLGDMGVMNSSW